MAKTKKENKRLVLLDAHAILHRAYHALPDFSSPKGEPTGALYGLSSMLIKIVNDLKPDYLAACYDLPGATFRHEAYADYKAQRKKADDDLVAQMIRSRDVFRAFGIPIYEAPGFEADDLLGTIAEKLKKNKSVDIIIASGDMDTLQLVDDERVRVYTLKKGINDTILYDEKGVIDRFGFGPVLLPDYKGLRGDPSDNIVGIRGIGEKSAEELIQKFGALEDMYKKLKKDEKAFEKAGIRARIVELLKNGEEEAIFSKTLALIRRDAPCTFEIPEKTWKESTDPEKIYELFDELGFRSMRVRAESMFGVPKPVQETLMGDMPSQAEIREVGTALWVLDSNIGNPSLDDILHFTKTKTLAEAKKVIFEGLKKHNVLEVYEKIERPLMPVVDRMEKRGVKIDLDYLKALSVEYHTELEKIEKKIWKLAGEEFNVSSPKQLSHVLFEKLGLIIKNHKKTSGGVKSTRESELDKMRDLHPIVAEILAHRELSKLLGTYIDTIPTQVSANGRLHAQFIQAGAATGRMSSQNPNLQNIPIKSDHGKRIRNAFIAENGYVLASFDYSQIELRIAAFLSGDKNLIKVFTEGGDVHATVASLVFGVPQDKVDPEMRRRAKVINFGIIYGMGVNALKENLGTDRATAQQFYAQYFETFSGLAIYLDKMKAEAERIGYTATYFGRRRYFEGIRSKIPYIKAAAERAAINAPIQGTEADVVKLALIKIDEYLSKEALLEDAYPLLQVHDELVYEIKEEKAKELSEKIQSIMENIIPPKEIYGIVLKANGGMGSNWGEIH